MRQNDVIGRFFMIAFFALFVQNVSCQNDFTIYKSWNFENELLDEYTDEEIRADFDVNSLYSHNTAAIKSDKINGITTKVLRVSHQANSTSVGFDLNANFEPQKEVYLSYNVKFSEEFNSTAGGKMPGLQGSPNIAITDGTTCIADEEGFIGVYLFKRANFICGYNYNRTYLPDCTWSSDEHGNLLTEHFFKNGTWYNVTQRIVMNSFTGGIPNADGINETWIDGRMVIQEKEQIFNVTEGYAIDILALISFYGGTGFNYQPQNECYTYFDNFVIFNPKNDVTLNTHNLHHPSIILKTPNEITNRDVYYDRIITSPGILKNAQYEGIYSPCIDEAYLIDAGEGNTVSLNLEWTIGGGDLLFFYDGNKSDSKLIRIVAGYDNAANQIITSSTRYLFIRFSSDTDIGSKGFYGTVSFKNENNPTEINNTPNIYNQEFLIKQAEFNNNYIGKIIAYDVDVDQEIRYSIEAGNETGLFLVNPQSGHLSTTTPNVFGDSKNTYELTVRVTDNGQVEMNNTATMKINFLAESSTIYVNPENISDPQEDGSESHPFDSWQDVVWQDGHTYLQKKGTEATVEKILITADNVTLGAYGEGDLPVIQSKTNTYLISAYDRRRH